MKLLCSPSSPYSSKVRMAARYLELNIEEIPVVTVDLPEVLIGANPLGKIPTLINDEGIAIYDSRAIMQYLDRDFGKKIYPRNTLKRLEVDIFEALCDGTCDSLLHIVYERRFKPAEKIHQPWLDMQWEKVERSLDYLENNLPRTTKNLNGGHFALAALIGYLRLRFGTDWERGRPKMKNWTTKFERFFPEHDSVKPQA